MKEELLLLLHFLDFGRFAVKSHPVGTRVQFAVCFRYLGNYQLGVPFFFQRDRENYGALIEHKRHWHVRLDAQHHVHDYICFTSFFLFFVLLLAFSTLARPI